jgi:hypothetical protein
MRDNNRLPHSLDELQPRYLGSLPRDVFGGASLIYVKNSEGFELSSVAEASVGKDETWQVFPPLQLRTRVSTNTAIHTPPNYTIVPGSSSNSDPNSFESIAREAERRAMENAAVSRRMQEEDEAKRKASR